MTTKPISDYLRDFYRAKNIHDHAMLLRRAWPWQRLGHKLLAGWRCPACIGYKHGEHEGWGFPSEPTATTPLRHRICYAFRQWRAGESFGCGRCHHSLTEHPYYGECTQARCPCAGYSIMRISG